MELIGGLLAALVLMALLAGVGLAAIVGLGVMGVLYFLTELDFKKVFLISAGLGLLAPILLAVGISSALDDSSLERDLRTALDDVIQLPEEQGDAWREALPKLREIGEAQERGELTDEEAERRGREGFAEFEDLQISIDVNGDGVVIGERDAGVPLELPEPVEAGEVERDGGQ